MSEFLIYSHIIPPKKWCCELHSSDGKIHLVLVYAFMSAKMIPPLYFINMYSNKDEVI